MNLPVKIAEIARISTDLANIIGDDEQCLADMVEGETDAAWLIQKLHDDLASDTELLTGIKAREAELKTRKERIAAAIQARKAAIGQVIRATGLSSWKLPEATYSVRNGKAGIEIVDKDAVPIEYQRATYAPDKAAINEAFADAETLPNWLAQTESRDVVTQRTK